MGTIGISNAERHVKEITTGVSPVAYMKMSIAGSFQYTISLQCGNLNRLNRQMN